MQPIKDIYKGKLHGVDVEKKRILLAFESQPALIEGIVELDDSTIFNCHYSIFLPAFAVWVLMMLDLIIHLLKTRHRFREAN